MVDTVTLEEATGPGPANATADGTPINLIAGDGGSTSGNGAAVNITGGSADGSGFGGTVNITGGEAVGTGNQGGTITAQAGSSDVDYGGAAYVFAGSGPAGGGEAKLQGGNATSDGEAGFVFVTAGDGAGANIGGEVRIKAGRGGSSGRGGHVTLTGGIAGVTDSGGGDIVMTPGAKSGTGVVGHVRIVTLENFADDAAAATGGVPVNGLYRTASTVKVRVA